MKDALFKRLIHTADNYQIIKNGQEIAKGYKPDAVLQNGGNYIILECDTSSTRKGFIGAMIKAAKYLSGDKTGIAVFVLQEKNNTTVNQIHEHLKPYFDWIQPLTNLQAVYIISNTKYCKDSTPLKILDVEFMRDAKAIMRVIK